MAVSVPCLPAFGDAIDGALLSLTARTADKSPLASFGNTAPERASTAREGNRFFQDVDLDESMEGLESMSSQINDVIERRLLRDIDFFRAADDDGSGAISYGEFSRILREEFGVIVSKNHMKQICKAFDNDTSGSIEYDELHDMLVKKKKIDIYVAPRHWRKIQAKLRAYREIQNVARQNPVSVETVQVRLGRRVSFPTYEILAGEQCHSGTCRPTNKLAIVAHPLHGGQFKDTPEHRAAYSMLHRILIEAGWNVLAFEANTLSAGGDGEVETAKLRAVMTHVASHRKFRYCKVHAFNACMHIHVHACIHACIDREHAELQWPLIACSGTARWPCSLWVWALQQRSSTCPAPISALTI